MATIKQQMARVRAATVVVGWVIALMLGLCLTESVRADNPYEGNYKASTKAFEWKYSLPRGFLGAICEQESRWDPNAISPKGALGICQIMPETFNALVKEYQTRKGLKPDGIIGPITWESFRPGIPYKVQTPRQRLLDPYQNIEWAAIYLNWIQQNVSRDPVVMAGVYYGGQMNQIVKYQTEVVERWEK